MVTQVLDGDVQPEDKIVSGVEQKAELDFVTSFVSRLTGNNKP
jgi:hypothetical protein